MKDKPSININTHTFRNDLRTDRKKALLISGGYEPHKPKEKAEILASILVSEGFDVEMTDSWDVFDDKEKIMQLDLIVPNYTMGTITSQQLDNFLEAVANGTGVAGMHGGMGDALRAEVRYQLMVGGQFMTHPEYRYKVQILKKDHPITTGINDFELQDEHYYMLIDPGIDVLATSYYEPSPPEITTPAYMPIIWTKKYGKGRVFYSSIGHSPETLRKPEVLTLMRRGMVWAAR